MFRFVFRDTLSDRVAAGARPGRPFDPDRKVCRGEGRNFNMNIRLFSSVSKRFGLPPTYRKIEAALWVVADHRHDLLTLFAGDGCRPGGLLGVENRHPDWGKRVPFHPSTHRFLSF